MAKTALATASPPPAASITLDIVKLVNVGSDPWSYQHDLHGNGTIAPGQTAIVPLAVALVNLGNPGARNEGKYALRDREIDRVNTLWGHYPGLCPPGHRDECMPTIQVFNLNDDRIWMIHDDPTGTNASADLAAQIDAVNDPNVLLNQLRQLQEEKLASARATAPPTTDDLPEAAQPKSVTPSQAARNRLRDEIPEAPDDSGPTDDKPRAPRSGR